MIPTHTDAVSRAHAGIELDLFIVRFNLGASFSVVAAEIENDPRLPGGHSVVEDVGPPLLRFKLQVTLTKT